MKIIEFSLTMPNKGSWNGKWSCECQLFAIVKKFREDSIYVKNGRLKQLLKERNFTYSWDDGWTANIEVKEITTRETNYVEKHSQGFYGYDWMIESLLEYGKIKLLKGEKEC